MNLVRTIAILAVFALTSTPLAAAESTRDIAYRFSMEAGEDVVQPGCTTFDYEANPCHQIATDMNGLDSPKIDILILVPVSPTAERDLRILRQSTEMWADGVEWMARDLGLDWMADGVEFHIFAEMINTGESEFTTYPIVDPEIVVIGTNPVGGIGIGIDPVDFAGIIFGEGASEGPCHGVENPFDMELWENLPGYDSHHDGRGGTYVEDCEGSGGNICFSVNAAVDPLAGEPVAGIDFNLYDLASHETGHCLTLGHVGDGAEGAWSSVPTNDIMAYDSDPPGKFKCVSSLDVEGLATVMSRYLDVNGDGVVDPDDHIHANDAVGEGDGRPFQIQHPDNHYYASPTRKAIDCPQPDVSAVPLSEVVNFTPEAPPRASLAIDGLLPMAHLAPGPFTFAGHINASEVPSQVQLSFREPPDAANETEGAWLLPNMTVPVQPDGDWSAEVDLSPLPAGMVIVAATWFDAEGEVVDADRTDVVIDPMLAPPAGLDSDDRDTPGLALPLAVIGLAAFAAIRRRG